MDFFPFYIMIGPIKAGGMINREKQLLQLVDAFL